MEQAKQIIVRFIHDNGLKAGDKLPSQEFFRQHIKCGTATVSAALNELKNDEVLEIRNKVGVFVIDPNADGHAGRTIGITAKLVEDAPYYSSLLGALQMQLISEGCKVHIFCNQNVKNTPTNFYSLKDFPGLKRMIDNNELEGIIHLDDFTDESLKKIHKAKIPALFVGAVGHSPDSVTYNPLEIIKSMCKLLPKLNVKKPALVTPAPVSQAYTEIFHQEAGNQAMVFKVNNAKDSSLIYNKLIKMSDSERPDMILYLDDVYALDITCKLALNIPVGKLPGAMILRSPQLMMNYPVQNPVFFDLDLTKFARQTASELLNAMKNNSTNIGKVYYSVTTNFNI